ncbi:MAG: hypothetical protein IT553_09745 [Sphingomonadaceae bacterium]|nr:hypothetical protein [Sphingomonadaceae bacterium]
MHRLIAARQAKWGKGKQVAQRTHFKLTGASRPYDPARQAIRPDLADVAEAAHHFAPHYARAVPYRLRQAAGLLASPTADADAVAQLAVGAEFALLDITGGWAWGYATATHVVGYLPADSVEPASTP